MKKALYVATVVKTHIMEFHIPYLKMLKEMGWETAVAARNDYENPADCLIPYCDKYYDIPFERNPILPGNIKAFQMLKKIIDEGDYDIIHCHTPVGALLTRLAARDTRKRGTKVIYTAHGFHFYSGAPLKNWLLYYPPEWLCAHWTDVLITINREDYERAKKHLHAKRVEYIPGVGIDVNRFMNVHIDRTAKREEIDVPVDAILLMSVGELNKNKNHSIIIKALSNIENRKIHYAIAGRGPLLNELRNLTVKKNVQHQVHFLGYRYDIPELYAIADICVFPSIREGLGLAAVEGMATGLPVIVSDNRGTRGFLTPENAITCRYDDVDAFAQAIRQLSEDKEHRERMGRANRIRSMDFDIRLIKQIMFQIYTN